MLSRHYSPTVPLTTQESKWVPETPNKMPTISPLLLAIQLNILHTVLYPFPILMTRRIFFTIKKSIGWRSCYFIVKIFCLIQQWYCTEKLDDNIFRGVKGQPTIGGGWNFHAAPEIKGSLKRVQSVKRSTIINAAIAAEECKSDRGLGRITTRPKPPTSFLPCLFYRDLEQKSQIHIFPFFKLYRSKLWFVWTL